MGILGLILVLAITSIAIYLYSGVESFLPEDMKKDFSWKEEKYQDRNVFVLSPKEEIQDQKTIIYIHGGAYLGELNREHWDLFRDIIQETNCQIIAPDYPLTPKYNYQDVFHMLVPFYEEIVEKVGTENLIVIGDSAGGGICLGLVEKMAEEKKPLPRKTILISPWLDARMTNPEMDEVQKKDPYLNKLALKLSGEAYAGSEGMKEYLVNPIEGPFHLLKDVIIFTGTDDILNPDVKILEQKAKEQDIDITVKQTEGAKHNWILKRKQKEYMAQEGYQDLIKEIMEY